MSHPTSEPTQYPGDEPAVTLTRRQLDRLRERLAAYEALFTGDFTPEERHTALIKLYGTVTNVLEDAEWRGVAR